MVSTRGALVLAWAALLAPPAHGADLCVAPSSGGANLSADCTVTEAYLNWWTGYGETPAELCENDGCDPGDIDCGCAADAGAHWSISRSAADPHDNVGTLSSNTLYLWMACTAYHSWSATEFSLSGSLPVVSFTPMNGFQNAGSGADLLLSHENGCLDPDAGPFLTGIIQLGAATAVDEPGFRSWGRVKAGYRVD